MNVTGIDVRVRRDGCLGVTFILTKFYARDKFKYTNYLNLYKETYS